LQGLTISAISLVRIDHVLKWHAYYVISDDDFLFLFPAIAPTTGSKHHVVADGAKYLELSLSTRPVLLSRIAFRFKRDTPKI